MRTDLSVVVAMRKELRSVDARFHEILAVGLRRVKPVGSRVLVAAGEEYETAAGNALPHDLLTISLPRADHGCDAGRQDPEAGVVGLVLAQVDCTKLEVEVAERQEKCFSLSMALSVEIAPQHAKSDLRGRAGHELRILMGVDATA